MNDEDGIDGVGAKGKIGGGSGAGWTVVRGVHHTDGAERTSTPNQAAAAFTVSRCFVNAATISFASRTLSTVSVTSMITEAARTSMWIRSASKSVAFASRVRRPRMLSFFTSSSEPAQSNWRRTRNVLALT